MLSLDNLTVGYVSGIVAAGVFSIQILVPLAFPLLLVGCLKPRGSPITASAVSWSVFGRYLQSSYWPALLSSDSAASSGVNRTILIISYSQLATAMLIGVAAIVTPLGLYEAVVPNGSSNAEFHYLKDNSPFGLATPPRQNKPFTRSCNSVWTNDELTECPNDAGNDVTIDKNGTRIFRQQGGNHNNHVPRNLVDFFESGLSTMNESVSSFFDMEWRSSSSTSISGVNSQVDHGESFPVGTLRPISSFIKDEKIVLVEGLIVDMQNGVIGLRNHSAPPMQPYGSSWTEDILFLQPESHCVDTNTTLDFSIGKASFAFQRTSLTDHGGFANINDTVVAEFHRTQTQDFPDLEQRARKGAYLNNYYSMRLLDKWDSDNNATYNSHVGKSFVISFPWTPIPSSLRPAQYIYPMENTLIGYGYDRGAKIAKTCTEAGEGDFADMSHIAIQSGLILGVPQSRDGLGNRESLFLPPRSNWTIPIYSCASAVKAVVKTVTFTFNGTDDLSGLEVTEIRDKTYPNKASEPIWAVEKIHRSSHAVQPLWGLVKPQDHRSPHHHAYANMSTRRSPHLYLPGDPSHWLRDANSPHEISQNLAGIDAVQMALSGVQNPLFQTKGEFAGTVDYTGVSDPSLLVRWQNLSRTAESAAMIPNLIFTDIAANAIVGTRGRAVNRRAGEVFGFNKSPGGQTYPVVVYERRIQYHWPYMIPAALVLFLTLCTLIAALVMLLMRRAGLSELREYIGQTSAGRLLVAQLNTGEMKEDRRKSRWSSESWVKKHGMKKITLGRGHPAAATSPVDTGETTPLTTHAAPPWRDPVSSNGFDMK